MCASCRHTCTHHSLKVLRVCQGTCQEPHKHGRRQRVAFGRGIPATHRFEQLLQEKRTGKLGGVVDQLERDGDPHQPLHHCPAACNLMQVLHEASSRHMRYRHTQAYHGRHAPLVFTRLPVCIKAFDQHRASIRRRQRPHVRGLQRAARPEPQQRPCPGKGQRGEGACGFFRTLGWTAAQRLCGMMMYYNDAAICAVVLLMVCQQQIITKPCVCVGICDAHHKRTMYCALGSVAGSPVQRGCSSRALGKLSRAWVLR